VATQPKPDRDTRNESFQCVVCALRQAFGLGGVDAKRLKREAFELIEEHNPTNLRTQQLLQEVKRHVVIPDWCWNPGAPMGFYQWSERDKEEEESDFGEYTYDTQVRRGTELDQWIDSCVNTAIALRNRVLGTRQPYIFYHSGLTPFKDVAKDILTSLANNSIDPTFKRFITLAAKGTADKWNPADIFAIQKGQKSILTTAEGFRSGSIPAAAVAIMGSGPTGVQKIQDFNKNNSGAAASKAGKTNMKIQEEMARLYDYNLWIDKLYEPGKVCVPISLKKAGPSPPITIYRTKADRGIRDAVNFQLQITNVDYKPTSMTVRCNFRIMTPDGWDDKWFMDMRGFEASKNIDDIQLQIQKGTLANHGKITLNFYSLIVDESGGKRAVDVYQRVRKKIFGPMVPDAKDHMMTPNEIFNDYAKIPGPLQRGTTFLWEKTQLAPGGKRWNQTSLLQDAVKWAQYVQWLSRGKGSSSVPTPQQVQTSDIMKMFHQKLGKIVGADPLNPKQAPGKRKGDWMKQGGKPVKYMTNQQDIIFAAKYIKTKVQAAEAGFIVDILRPTIKTEVKNNIMKSAYMYGASKGLRIFNSQGAIEHLSSSTYVKVGG